MPGQRIRQPIVQPGLLQRHDPLAELLHRAELADADRVQAAGQIGGQGDGRAGRGDPPAEPPDVVPPIAEPVLPGVKVDQQPERIQHHRERADLVYDRGGHRRNPSARRGRDGGQIEERRRTR